MLHLSAPLPHSHVDLHKNNVSVNESYKSGVPTEHIEDINVQESSEDLPAQQSEESLETLSTVPSTVDGEAEAARPSTPPMVNNLMEMGFSRPQINVALERYTAINMFGDFYTVTDLYSMPQLSFT